MSRMRLISVLALAVCSALALAVPANAANGADDSYGAAACFVNGAAGTANNGGVDDVVADLALNDNAWDPLNLLDTDGGNFAFTSANLLCAGVDVGGATIGAGEGGPLNPYTINAGTASTGGVGIYTNLICGTGHAQGTADLFDAGGGTNITTSLSVDFHGGVGALAITNFNGTIDLNHPVLGTANPQDIDTGWGSGVVHIAPAVGNCVNAPVTQFTVDSAFVVTLSGDENTTGPDARP
jgi:hypothetical protein